MKLFSALVAILFVASSHAFYMTDGNPDAIIMEKHSQDFDAGNGEMLRLTGSVVNCKDGSECPLGSTCCEIKRGSYGCCPIKNATCCNDHIHCCPSNYTCDLKDHRCVRKGKYSFPLMTKIPAKRPAMSNHVKLVDCGDGTACHDGSTCCKLSNGQFGCCPYPKAVCCDDHIHCCPSGYTCDTTGGHCNKKGQDSVPLLTKTTAKFIHEITSVKATTCKDGSSCPSTSSCCPLDNGTYGCCPMVNAVCCSDHIHCCPSGYTCDLKNKRCLKQGSGDFYALLMKLVTTVDNATLN